jgi:hypothetical protein
MNRRERRQSCKSLRPRPRAWSCLGSSVEPDQKSGITALSLKISTAVSRELSDGSGTRLDSNQVRRPPRRIVRGERSGP